MKPQDIIFLFVLLILFWRKNPKLFVWAGLVCLILSIPLFAFWVFFTAQHLVWYAVGFFIMGIVIALRKKD